MRALVVDDDDAFRTLVVALLAEVADVVEQAADGDVAVQLARDLRPDLIVMDITMPRMHGISAARAILAVHPRRASCSSQAQRPRRSCQLGISQMSARPWSVRLCGAATTERAPWKAVQRRTLAGKQRESRRAAVCVVVGE
jgi:CheY-like chemotaxis protein